MMPLARALSPLGRTLLSAMSYLLRDEFTTAEAAPIANPRTCEPGPGSFDISDSENKISISGGNIVFAAGATNHRIFGGVKTRSNGLTTLYVLPGAFTGNTYCYLRSAIAGTIFCGFGDTDKSVFDGSTSFLHPNPMPSYTFPARMYFIQRSSGAFIVINDELVWPGVVANGNGGELVENLNNAFSVDAIRTTQLGSPFNSDYGICTASSLAPSSGETLSHEANCLVEITWTAATGGVLELDVRKTDADNRWIIRCDQAGGTIKLIERNSGIETERSSAAQTWTNGVSYRIVVTADVGLIYTVVNRVRKNVYTSATFNQFSTQAHISVTAGSLGTFVTWPRNFSGAALAVLEAI